MSYRETKDQQRAMQEQGATRYQQRATLSQQQQQAEEPKQVGMQGSPLQKKSLGGLEEQGLESLAKSRAAVPDEWKPVMREDYGWKMNEQQYASLESSRKEMEKNINKFKNKANADIASGKSNYEKTFTTYQNQVKAAKAKFDAAALKLKQAQNALGQVKTPNQAFESWYQSTKVPVRVVNGNNVEGTYYIPRAVVSSMHAGKGPLTAGWVDGGKNYNIEVRQSGRIMGQEMHNMARGMANKNFLKQKFMSSESIQGDYRKYLTEYTKQKNLIKSSYDEFNKTKGLFISNKTKQDNLFAARQAEIRRAEQARDTAIGGARKNWKGQISGLRESYEALTARRKLAYSNLAKDNKYSSGRTSLTNGGNA